MIESIEGKRGLPRHRPPYVAQVGLFGRPTLEQNVETLFWVRDIVEKGAAWFTVARPPRAQGLSQLLGLRPREEARRRAGARRRHGARADRRILRRHGRRATASRAICRAAPRAASCRPSMADLPLDFGTLEKYGCFVGSHAVVILSDQDDMKAVALNLMKFFEDESCGQCTPCRVGTEKAVKLMAQGPWNAALLTELSDADARRLDLRPRPGRAQSAAVRAEIFPRGTDEAAGPMVRSVRMTATLESDAASSTTRAQQAQHLLHRRSRGRHPRGRDDLPRRAPARHQAAASVLHAQARLSAGRQLPRLHGRDRGRARARRKLHPHADARHEGEDADRARQDRAPHGGRAAGHRPAGVRRTRTIRTPSSGRSSSARRSSPAASRSASRSRAGARPQPPGDGGQSRRLHPLQSLRPRLPRGAGQRRDRHGRPRPSSRRSCSTSTIRWAPRPASPAANACRPARPAR